MQKMHIEIISRLYCLETAGLCLGLCIVTRCLGLLAGWCIGLGY